MQSNNSLLKMSPYDVITAPIVSEKSTLASSNNTYFFKIPVDVTKQDVKLAIEKIFKVTVLFVNTSVLKGKEKRFKGRLGNRADCKKAMARLKDGDVIDFGAKVN